MSFSSTVLEYREKEAQALKFFLIYSLISSVALHIGILALGLGHWLTRVSKIDDKPLEIEIVEVPQQEVVKPINQSKLRSQGNSGVSKGGGGSNKPVESQTSVSGETSVVIPVEKQPMIEALQHLPLKNLRSPKTTTNPISKPVQSTIPVESEPSEIQTSSIQKLVDRLTNHPSQTTTPIAATKPVVTKTAEVVGITTKPTTSPLPISANPSITKQPQTVGSGYGNGVGSVSGNGVGSGSGNSVGSGSGNGVGSGSGNGVGSGSGNGVGNGSGNGVGNQTKKEDTTVATAPKPPTDNSSRLDRADCLKCDTKYPDRARKRGVEGNPEVAVDTDKNGNVTRVRLIRSSGDSELDEAAQRAAQEWKLKPTSTDRQGVRASVNFAIQGSERHRELQERQRKREREAQQKKPEKSATIPTPTESPQRSQRLTTGVITDVPQVSNPKRPRQRVESDKPNQTEESTPRRQRVESENPSQTEETRDIRVQKRRKRLEEILRRRQKPSESPPETPTPPEFNSNEANN